MTNCWSVSLTNAQTGDAAGHAKIFARNDSELQHALHCLRESALSISTSTGDDSKQLPDPVETRFVVGEPVALPRDPNYVLPDNLDISGIWPLPMDPRGAGEDIDSIPQSCYMTATLTPEVSLIVYESSQNNAHRLSGKHDQMRFYFTPLFLVQAKDADYQAVDGGHYVRFPMFLYHDSLRQSVVDVVRSNENITIKPEQVGLLPINRMDIRERLGTNPNLRYVSPVTTAPGSTRPVLSPLHWIDMRFDNEADARSFHGRLVAGRASFNIDLPYSGRATTTDMAIIRITQSDKTQMKNTLAGTGGDRYVSRGQQMAVTREILSRMEQYQYQESAEKQVISTEAVIKMMADNTFPVTPLNLATYNSEVWAKFSEYGFDKRDIAPDKITKIIEDIKQSQSYRQANSKNIGASAQAGFLGFSGSVSGSYASQEEYEAKLDFAFHREQEGEWYVPKAINVAQTMNIAVTSDTIVTQVSSVVRPGEGRLTIQREASSAWTPPPPAPPAPPPAPEIEISVGPVDKGPFGDNFKENIQIGYESAKSIRVIFDRFDMETDFDFVTVRKLGATSGFSYTGRVPGGFVTGEVLGNAVQLRTWTDQSAASPGWTVRRIRCKV